jgi:hypothetical protein
MSQTETHHAAHFEPKPQRALSAWIQLAALASFAALAAPFFWGRVYVADDLGEFHLPVRNFYAEQLRRGESFDWMPGLYGGFYVAAEGQLGAYHPLHLLAYRWLPLGAAFDLELLASYPLMFLGMSLFLRRLVGRRDAALFGALAFTFCGFNLLHFVHPNAVAIVAHLPWLLLAIDVALSANDARRRAVAELAVGLLTASQLLLGYPQFVWFSLLAETAFVAWRLLGAPAELRRVVGLLWAQALGAMAAGIQLLPTMHALAGSVRRIPDADFANSGSLHPLNLVQLVAPYLFQTRVVGQNTHELGLYAGAVPCLLCIWLVGQRRNWQGFRPLVLGLIVCGLLALLLAAGEFGGLYRLQAWVPLANRFRFPCRAIVLVQFCMAVGAAVAIGLMLSLRAEPKTDRPARGIGPVWIAFLLSVALALVAPLIWPEYVADPLLVWCGPLLVGAAAVLISLTLRGARGAAVALVIFTALDLSCYGLSYSVCQRTADLHDFVAEISLPPDHSNLRVAAAADGTTLRTGDRMLLAGLQRIDGYAGLEPARQLDYATTPALQLAGVGWVWHTASNPSKTAQEWTRIAPTAPRARLVTQTVSSEHPDDIATLGMEVAAVEQPVALPPASPGDAQVTADAPGRITIETQAPTRQLLITTESYDSGWQAVVDDQPQPAVRVNGDFLGCVVDAGRHHVGFEFRPWSLRAGALASACGLGLLLCTCWFRVRRAPNHHHP